MSWQEIYKQKLVSVEEAAAAVKSNDRVWYPPCGSAPVDILQALAKRYMEVENVNLYTALVLYPLEYMKGKYKGHLNHNTIFLGPHERKVVKEGNVQITSYPFGQTDWVTRNRIKPNVFLIECSLPDENGYMSYGPLGTFNGDTVASMAERIIVQVNPKTPYVYGTKAHLHVKDAYCICEKEHDIAVLPNPPVTDVDKTIAASIVERIEDGSTVQIGIGGLANAVAYLLEAKKDLGVHTEMLVDSLVALAKKGVVTGSKKTLHRGVIACGFGIGSQELYQFMNRNQMCQTFPISYIADPKVVALNDKFISVNNTLAVDLTGQICSESLGFDMFSGTGGQLDFVRGAAMSNGGKSFIALKSVAETKHGLVSKITAKLEPGTTITVPRTDAQFIVTEYGVADLRHKSIPERVKELIAIAHPDFRDQLTFDAKQAGLLV